MYVVGILLLGFLYRKHLIQIVLGLFIFLFLAFNLGTERQKINYDSMFSNIKNFQTMLYQVKTIKKDGKEVRTMKHADVASKSGSGHFYIYNTVINIWKENKIFGIGPKNFYERCVESDHHLNRLCVNHPHNYTLDILVSSGIIGILSAIILSIYLIIISFKKFLSSNYFSDKRGLILVPATIVFILEAFLLDLLEVFLLQEQLYIFFF